MPDSVTVRVNGREYVGELVAVFRKREGELRCIIEDVCRKLTIHNAKQLGLSDDGLIALGAARGVPTPPSSPSNEAGE